MSSPWSRYLVAALGFLRVSWTIRLSASPDAGGLAHRAVGTNQRLIAGATREGVVKVIRR